MSDEYKDFLGRLVRYRIRLNMTQEMMSAKLGITQSQLSKQELGKIIVPYKSLVNYMQMGWNVDYLLVGEDNSHEISELSKILCEIDDMYYSSMLGFITWILTNVMGKLALSLEEKCELSILQMMSSNEVNGSIMYVIRKVVGENQISMAEKLGVNIKKYRALEKQQVYPDAELLLEIYQITGCRPSLFLMTGHIEIAIINDLWSKIDKKKRDEILSIMMQVIQFLKEVKES